MLSLYNLFEQVILEGVGYRPKIEDVQKILKDTKAVNIVYNDGTKNANLGVRYCQVLALGKTSKGNIAIRVYQVSGPNLKANKKGGKIEHWKTFLLNKIEGWDVTNFRFYAPPDELYNALGDKTLNIPNNNGLADMAIFGGKYLANYRNRYLDWQSDVESKKTNEPLKKDRVSNVPNNNTGIDDKEPNNYGDIKSEPNNSNNQNYVDDIEEPDMDEPDIDDLEDENEIKKEI